MARKGKKKRTAADEAENSLGPGLEQPLEEEEMENNIDENQKDRKYRRKKQNDGTNESLLMENIKCLRVLEKKIENLAEGGTPSEPPNAAAGSSGSPHNEECKFSTVQKLLELVREFCEKHGITEEFKAFCKKHEEKVEEQGKFCEELGMSSEALWEDGANQHSNKEIQMILKNLAKNSLATLEENLESEMIQTVGIEGVAAMNSSSFGATGTPFEQARELKRKREEGVDGACRGKRPATTYSTTPSSGFMAEARQKDHQLAAALATRGPLLLTNKATQIQMREAAHDKEASTSSWAPPPQHELGLGSKQEVSMYNLMKQYVKLEDAKRRQEEAAAAFSDANRKFKEKKKEVDNLNKQMKGEEEVYNKLKVELAEKAKISKDALDLQMIDSVTLGWNLMKELLQSMQPGSEFLNLPLLDTTEFYPSLQNQFNECLTLIVQGHPINDKIAIQSDNPPVVVPRSFFFELQLVGGFSGM